MPIFHRKTAIEYTTEAFTSFSPPRVNHSLHKATMLFPNQFSAHESSYELHSWACAGESRDLVWMLIWYTEEIANEKFCSVSCILQHFPNRQHLAQVIRCSGVSTKNTLRSRMDDTAGSIFHAFSIRWNPNDLSRVPIVEYFRMVQPTSETR